VRGDISGETSLTEDMSPGIEGQELGAKKGPFTFFTIAKLTVDGVEFRADENGWTWDGKDHPPSGKRVELIARPKVITLLNDPNNACKILIQSEQPIEYFEKRPDGLFELRRDDEQIGLSLAFSVAEGKSGRVVLRDLTIGLRSVEGRSPIEGVTLDVGRPIVRARKSKMTISVKTGRDYGVCLRTEGYGNLYIRLRVSRVPPGRTNISRIPEQIL